MQSKDTALDEVKSLIIKGEDEKAKALIESSCLLDATDNHGRTLLHFAAEHNVPSMARYLLDEGCDLNPIDATGSSPLMLALKTYSYDEVLAMLLDAGADIEREDRTGQSPLRMALKGDGYIADSGIQLILKNLRKKCGGSSEETAKRLIDEGCRLDQAAFLKDARVIDCMLKLARDGVRTALHVAVSLDDAQTVKLLLERDADLHRAQDHCHVFPLNYLYYRNVEHNNEKIEIVKSFLRAGASPTDCERLLGTFQAGATLIKGSAKAIRVLMRSGIDCSARDEYRGRSVIHYLAENANEGLAKVLEAYAGQFDLNAPDDSEIRPLNCAAKALSAEMLKFLLEHGSEVDRVGVGRHFTPLIEVYASWNWKPRCGKRYGKCVNLLLQHGADPQFVAGQGRVRATIFTIAKGRKRVRPLVARLALMERLGAEIADATRDEINSYWSLTKYWERCQRMLDQRFYSRFTIYDLLTGDRKRMTRYVKIIESLGNIKKMQNICSYYRESIKRRFLKYSKYVKSQATVRAVLCELLENRVGSSNIIIERIEDYLDDRSLENLYEMGKNGDLSK